MLVTDKVSPLLDEKILNRKLKQKYGFQDGRQNFRLVRTNTQTEIRRKLDPYNPTKLGPPEICLRYGYLERPYWALEKLWPVPEGSQAAEMLPASKWSYEPIYVFLNPETKAELPVTEDVLYAMMDVFLYGQKKRAKTEAELNAEEEALYEKQAGVILDYLQNECPSMAMQLKTGRGIVAPENTSGDSNNRESGSDANPGVQTGDGS